MSIDYVSPEALQKRREIAEKATRGPWVARQEFVDGPASEITIAKIYIPPMGYEAENVAYRDATHIAANSPDAVIAMIDEIARLRVEKSELEELVKKLSYKLGVKDGLEFCQRQREVDELKAENARLNKESNYLALHQNYDVPPEEPTRCPPNYEPPQSCVESDCRKCWREAARKAVSEAQKENKE